MNKKAVNGEAVRSLHTPSPLSWMGGNDKSSGANALSLTAGETISQNPSDCQAQTDSANSSDESTQITHKRRK